MVSVSEVRRHHVVDVDLPNYIGGSDNWTVVATDSAGQTASGAGSIALPSGPWFAEQLSVTGRILDFDGTRYLATNDDGHTLYLDTSPAWDFALHPIFYDFNVIFTKAACGLRSALQGHFDPSGSGMDSSGSFPSTTSKSPGSMRSTSTPRALSCATCPPK